MMMKIVRMPRIRLLIAVASLCWTVSEITNPSAITAQTSSPTVRTTSTLTMMPMARVANASTRWPRGVRV